MGSSHHFLLSFCCFRKICYIKWIQGTQKIIFKTKLWKWMQAGCEIWDVCLVWLLNLSSGSLWQELVPREAQLGSHWASRRSILSKRNPPFVSLVSDYHVMSILTLNLAPIHSPCHHMLQTLWSSSCDLNLWNSESKWCPNQVLLFSVFCHGHWKVTW